MAEPKGAPRPGRAGLLLYCVGHSSPASPCEGRGLEGSALERVNEGQLTAVISPLADLERVARPVTADLLLFQHVIQQQHAAADVLPMRFGGVLPDEAAVRAHLCEQQGAYLRALARVAGCVEMGARARVPAPSPPTAGEAPAGQAIRSGADYMRARQRHHAAELRLRDRCEALTQALLTLVAPLSREHHAEISPLRPGEPALLSLVCLVPRERAIAFREALSPMVKSCEAEIALSGPWPPYHFV